jgi:hypothetical protein
MNANSIPTENALSRMSVRSQPDDGHALDAEHEPVGGAEPEAELLGGEVGVHRVHHEVQPARAPFLLAPEELDRLHAAHRLEEVALLLGGVDDVLLGGAAQRIVEDPAQRAVEGDTRRRRSP